MNFLLGIDAGTTAFKAVLFDDCGKVVASATRQYELLLCDGSRVEFPPEEYWSICRALIGEVLHASGVDAHSIAGLAISSQGETLICVDSSGQTLGNAIVWLDNRSVRQADRIKDHFGVRVVYEATGQPEIVATWPATKILWLKENQAHLFHRTAKFLLLEDYLLYRLTGSFVSEKSIQSSSLLLDINRGQWWGQMLDFIGITPQVLPKLAQSGQVVGEVTSVASRETGLATGTPVVAGALDQVAGMIGAGNITPGTVTETTGTALAMCVNVAQMSAFDPKIKVPCHYSGLASGYCLILWAQTAGMTLKWFADNFYNAQERDCPSSGRRLYEVMDDEARVVPAGADGMIMLPHLSGAACPEFNPRATGVFSGITLKHTRGHFVRSILESIGFMLRSNLLLLEQLGIEVGRITSLGGGARSALWNRIKSDITGKPIVTLKNSETACLGAALLAGAGTGVFPSLDAACRKVIEVDEAVMPDPATRAVYDKAFERYIALYRSLEGFF